MKLINIITSDLLITDCYLEKVTNDISVLKKEKLIISYINLKFYKLKFLFKHKNGANMYGLIKKRR